MSRRISSQAVSLFPFLAVLMCALGALILLLLVTASRIHDQTVERAKQRQQPDEVVVDEPVIEPPAVVVAEPEPLPERQEVVPLPPAGPTEDELRREWEGVVAGLESQAAQLAQQLEQQSRLAGLTHAELTAAESELDALRERAGRLSAQQAELIASEVSVRTQRATLSAELKELEAAIAEARRNQEQQQSKFRILPYDGQTGTTRRPILIECNSTGLTFAAERITLTPEQLNGFTPLKNPLLAGVDALITYWSVQDLRSGGADSLGRPYVLLVVRPEGTVGYYVARRLLEAMSEPFGYELVGSAEEFQWPERDPQAAAVCQAAIDAVLEQRARLQSQVAGGRLPVAGPLQFTNGDGRFYLEEVERLRGDGRTVHFGGRTYERSGAPGGPGGSNGSPAGAGPASSADRLSSSDRLSGGPMGSTGAPGSGTTGGVTPRVIEIPRTGRAGTGPNGAQGEGQTDAAADESLPGSAGQPNPLVMTERAAPLPGASQPQGGGLYDGQIEPRTSPSGERSGESTAWKPARNGEEASTAGRSSTGTGRETGTGRFPGQPGGGGGGGGEDNPFAPGGTANAGQLDASRLNPRAPEWGVRSPGSSIGLEREVVVRVNGDQVAVERELPITITPGMTREELQRSLAETLDAHIRAWGMPPKSFYWLPLVRYQVLPGGNQYLRRLTDVTDEWAVKSRVEYVLE